MGKIVAFIHFEKTEMYEKKFLPLAEAVRLRMNVQSYYYHDFDFFNLFDYVVCFTEGFNTINKEFRDKILYLEQTTNKIVWEDASGDLDTNTYRLLEDKLKEPNQPSICGAFHPGFTSTTDLLYQGKEIGVFFEYEKDTLEEMGFIPVLQGKRSTALLDFNIIAKDTRKVMYSKRIHATEFINKSFYKIRLEAPLFKVKKKILYASFRCVRCDDAEATAFYKDEQVSEYELSEGSSKTQTLTFYAF